MNRRDKSKEYESNAAFAVAAGLMNILIVLILCCGVWGVHELVKAAQPTGDFFEHHRIYR